MRKIKLLSIMLIAALTLSACQSGVTNETVAIDAGEVAAEAVEESVAEAVVEEAKEEKEEAAQTSSEEVAKFPVRDEKIPPYEIALRDGSTVKLDQYEGQVVVLTFFTTW